MKIAVSACLLGENCKYNGGSNYNAELAELLKGHDVIAVCPEVLGGLPVPRTPSEIVEGEVITRDGISVDREFKRGAELAFEIVRDSNAELVILQPRSPSCGAEQIYDGTFSGKLIPGEGIFARLLRENGIPAADVKDAMELLRHRAE